MSCSRISLMLVIPLFFLLHFPMTCSLSVHNSSTCHMDDNLALLQFKSSFTIGANNCGGKAYAKTASWRDGTDCCKWDGVQCNPVTGRVIGLDLSCSLLKGNIDSNSSLFLLPYLRRLDLGSNQLIGALPSSANQSWNSSLTEIHLSDNLLTGMIPSWLFALPSVQYFYLSGNQFTGQISEFKSSSLIEIDLSNNKLSGTTDLNIFARLENLTSLFLSNNDLSVVMMDSSSHARWDLLYLNLSSCDMSEIPESLRGQQHLSMVDLSKNRIHGEIPKWMQDLGFLLGSLLNLSHNSLTGGSENLPWVDFIDISSNMIEGPIPDLSPPMARLFSAKNNRLSGEIHSLICNCPHLVIFDVSNNSLSGEIPPCLFRPYNSLYVLDLRHNKLNGSLPPNYEMCYLKTLQLNGNQLEGQVPPSLAKCGSLEVLDLGNNRFTGTFPHWVDTLPEMQVLILRNNSFQGVISSSTTKHPFPKLQILDLSGNNFSGPLPRSYIQNFTAMKNTVAHNESLRYVGGDLSTYYQVSIVLTMKGSYLDYEKVLTILTTIDLSNNRFQGEIPGSLGQLISLVGLNLSHNYLGSQIPSSLGDLTVLESLDLSFNNLTGEIPQHFANLLSLEYFNVSENQLVGPIPRGKQLDTFLSDSYLGNPGLCGFPLRACGETPDQPIPPYVTQADDDSDSTDLFEWEIILMGYGCGLVFGLVGGWYMFLLGKPFCLLKWIYKVEFFTENRTKCLQRRKRR